MAPEFFRTGGNCWAVRDASHAGVLVDADAYYRAFAAAAERAEHSILICGWQFDTTVALVRDGPPATWPTFLDFLNRLCARKPEIRVRILAWDFSPVFGADREWRQEWLFRWKGHPNISFAFDDSHPVGASHHQKLVVIDGFWAFVGGMDICNGRWDVVGHPGDLAARVNPDGRSYHPKHDLQAVLEGEPALELARWFADQWRTAGNPPFGEVSMEPKRERPFRTTVEFPAGPVGLSLTRGRTLLPPRRAVKQIQELIADAVAGAERLIYIENQYLTSNAVVEALRRRLADTGKPGIEIMALLPKDRAPMERSAISRAESNAIRALTSEAARSGRTFRVFHPLTAPPGEPRPVWLHAKLMIVDDRFLTLGSANLANRSMGFDTEINAAWWSDGNGALGSAVRGLRGRLIAEHLGLDVEKPPAWTMSRHRVVDRVETEARRTGRMIVRTEAPDPEARSLTEAEAMFDPSSAPVEDRLDAFMADSPNSPVARGISSLVEWLSGRRARRRRQAEEAARR